MHLCVVPKHRTACHLHIHQRIRCFFNAPLLHEGTPRSLPQKKSGNLTNSGYPWCVAGFDCAMTDAPKTSFLSRPITNKNHVPEMIQKIAAAKATGKFTFQAAKWPLREYWHGCGRFILLRQRWIRGSIPRTWLRSQGGIVSTRSSVCRGIREVGLGRALCSSKTAFLPLLILV